MKFLITNDDGLFAPGVAALVEVVQHFGEVYVICPDQERSAISHSITLRQPLRATAVSLFGANVHSWAVSGTPVDCVKLGLDVLLKEKPDFIISGINLGPNLGRDVYYSGTIAAAAEGALFNIPSLAISLDRFTLEDLNFKQPKRLLFELLETTIAQKFPEGVFLNINLPYLSREHCQGVEVVKLDLGVSRYKYVGLNDPHGHVFHWLKDQFQQLSNLDEDGDYMKLKAGFVTVTPLEGKITQRKHTKRIHNWFHQTLIPKYKEEKQR